MNSETKSCYIYSDNKSLSPVFLPDKQEVFVGRSIDTKITDTQCSRKQVRLFASYADQKVFVQQVGTRPSGLNGFKTKYGVKLIAQHGDCLEVLYGKHFYKIEFNPKPTTNAQSDKSKKRILLEDDETQSSKKPKLNSQVDDTFAMEESTSQGSSEENKMEIDDMPSTSVATSSDRSEDSKESDVWEDFCNKTLYVYTSSGCKGRSKIAAYDMDRTLIKTKSGLQFPKDYKDWQLLYPQVPEKLKEYYDNGYKIVIFSNQASLGTGKTNVKDFKIKIERLVNKISIPMQVYLAAGHSIFRKPCTGMWDFLVNQKNDDVPVDKNNSFYVGDAAGRPASASRKKKDHSLADRLLALNLDLKFYTPEEHFLGHKRASYDLPNFHPREASKNTILYEPAQTQLTSDKQEVIIMVGCPGSGKSHFAKVHLQNYCYVNRDTLGSWQKCIEKTNEAIIEGKSVVIDNTNPDKVSRQRYINVARKYNIPVRCFVMSLNKDHAKHNNMFRRLTDSSHLAINDMIINGYIKNYISPSEDEGFSEIVKINFVPFFKSEEDRKLYEMYLLG